MARWIALGILLTCFLIFSRTYWIWYLNQARRKGIFPPQNEATLFDVRELLQKGEKELAIRLYMQIYRTGRHDSQKAVEELEKSMKDHP